MSLRPLLAVFAALASAADWPEWRGQGRRGVWEENGIVDRLPTVLQPVWRAPVAAGYSGPAVAAGRVFVTDFLDGRERLHCLDERSGRQLWLRDWEADYRGIDYASGPRATPTVDGPLVYVQGSAGALRCYGANDGELKWSKEFKRDYSTRLPAWGMSAAPLAHKGIVIAVVGGRPDAKVMAFHRTTGAEMWRALSSEDSEPGYSQPLLIRAGGRDQLIVWHAGAVESLDPATGKPYWNHPFKVHMSTPIATPVHEGPYLLVSAFFQGTRMFKLEDNAPRAELVWRGNSESERNTETIHALMASPIVVGGYVYGICNYGELRCLKASTGERVWETQNATVEKARNVSAFLVRHLSRTVIFNDRGELIFAHLSPEGYEELSRAKLIEPTSKPGARRELGAVVWAHPAFANRHVVARNDREVVRVSLAR